MPPCILDTNIIGQLFVGHPMLVQKAQQHLATYGVLYITIFNWYEVKTGYSYKAQSQNEAQRRTARTRLRQFEEFCNQSEVRILDLDKHACEETVNIYVSLRHRGRPYERGLDIFIAGIARARGLTIVTENTSDFADIDNLSVENWLVE